jgi:hypothetical protein
MSRKCLEQLNNKNVLDEFDSKIKNGISEKVAVLEILNKQISSFKNEYTLFINEFKDFKPEINKFKIIEDNINNQIQELSKIKVDNVVEVDTIVENKIEDDWQNEDNDDTCVPF